jgi:DNA-binding MarR family transcriptional regulator
LKSRKKHSAAVTRKLALLRAHGLIRRVPKRHLYHVTAKGRRAITALLTAQQASIEELTKMAA